MEHRNRNLTINSLYQCGYSEYLNRQSSDGDAPLVVINYKVLLQLLVVLKTKYGACISLSRRKNGQKCKKKKKIPFFLFYLCELNCKKPLELCLHQHATENQFMYDLACSLKAGKKRNASMLVSGNQVQIKSALKTKLRRSCLCTSWHRAA